MTALTDANDPAVLVVAFRLREALGLPDDFTGHVTIHFNQGEPSRKEYRVVSSIQRGNIDPPTATNVA